MMKTFPLALLLCLFFSLSGFAPAQPYVAATTTHTLAKNAFAIPFPITGQVNGRAGVGQPCGMLNYTISGGNNVPGTITLYTTSGTYVAGPYAFSNGGSGNLYTAASQDMQNKTGIVYIQFIVGGGVFGYTIIPETMC